LSQSVQGGFNGAWATDSRGNAYQRLFDDATANYGLPAGLLRRMAWQESRFNPTARSGAGALGMMQFMPATASQYGVTPMDSASSIDGAGRYMRDLYKMAGSWRGAIASYNWGVGNYKKYLSGKAKMPLETVNYLSIADDLGL
jgi:soluble lytic murein transglycosylase-like protein